MDEVTMKKLKQIAIRITKLLVVVAIVALLLNPVILVSGGFIILKWLLILLLAGIVARIVFKKSLRELIFGDDKDDVY